MHTVIEILNVVGPVFLILALGFGLKAIGFFSAATVGQLSRLVFYVAAPILLFRSAALTALNEELNLHAIAAIFVVTCGQAAAIYLLCFRSRPPRRGVLAQGTFRSNLVFVGFPIVASALGDKALGLAALYTGFVTPFYNLAAVIVLTLPHHRETGPRFPLAPIVKGIALNPLIIACVAGIFFAAFRIPLPTILDRTLKLAGDVATPLALLVVGASLNFDRLRAETRAAVPVALVKLIVYPALVFTALRWLGLGGIGLQTPVLLLAAPTAVVSHIMAREMKGDDQLAGAIVIGSTLLSLFTISLWLAFFRWLGAW